MSVLEMKVWDSNGDILLALLGTATVFRLALRRSHHWLLRDWGSNGDVLLARLGAAAVFRLAHRLALWHLHRHLHHWLLYHDRHHDGYHLLYHHGLRHRLCHLRLLVDRLLPGDSSIRAHLIAAHV